MVSAVRSLLVALLLALPAAMAGAQADESVVVFAAASLKTALDEAAAAFKAQGGAELKISYGGSLALARQLDQGAPADIFASADQDSMDYAADKTSIQPKSRFDLLGNSLVVVANKKSNLENLAFTPEAFVQALGAGRLATGDVKSVPVGKYAKAALEQLGLWAAVEPRLAMSENVRAAMTFVARDEAPLGIVYVTDAMSEPNVKVVATFPDTSHPPIVYPVALTAGSTNPAAQKFLDFLRSDMARPLFEKQGFLVLKR